MINQLIKLKKLLDDAQKILSEDKKISDTTEADKTDQRLWYIYNQIIPGYWMTCLGYTKNIASAGKFSTTVALSIISSNSNIVHTEQPNFTVRDVLIPAEKTLFDN